MMSGHQKGNLGQCKCSQLALLNGPGSTQTLTHDLKPWSHRSLPLLP
jgi:hypothetical protein